MSTLSAILFATGLSLSLTPSTAPGLQQARASFEPRPGDRICLVGGALAERMQHDGYLEAELQRTWPTRALSMRNLGFSGDELDVRQRTAGFGSPDEHLERVGADVVFAFFGGNESFDGEAGLDEFEAQLTEFVRHTRAQTYGDDEPTRVVLFGTLPVEFIDSPPLPTAAEVAERNRVLALYDQRIAKVAGAEDVPFVPLAGSMRRAYEAESEPLTLNGAFLTPAGNARLARAIVALLAGAVARQADEADAAAAPPTNFEMLRSAIVEKNLLWFNRYRATDGYNVYGGRSSLAYVDDVTNFTVLQRELEHLDALCDRFDAHIRSIAAGEPQPVDREGLPELIEVVTNRPGEGPGGEHLFLDAEAAIEKMTPAPGMVVELFASEEDFPELVNPVQMAWDTRGRLWVACWHTYPHWKPGQPMDDRLLIFEDTDGDGRADRCTHFADDLHNPTGFEFYGGGVLVANAPDLLFLKDTDGDDRADHRERWLHGLSSADTHHSANSFVVGPDGALYFQEGTFHMSQVESIHGPLRNHNGCVWRFEPRTWRVERYVPYNFANPHGHVFDHWGQDFVTDGTGNVNYYALPFSGFIEHPAKHGGYFPFFAQRSRPCAGTEILSSSHFPEENQGNYLIANVIGFQGIFQYDVLDDGSGFRAEEVDPLVFSSDSRFRPSDIEVGPDGAVYFLDWHNPLIGHMQHHLRDPSRDTSHGRIYRVRRAGVPLLDPLPIAGEPIEVLLERLKEPDDRVRYRARLELSGRDSAEVVRAARKWLATLDEQDPAAEHHRLEGLWLQQQHDVLDLGTAKSLLQASDPRARAAAVRVVRQMRHRLEGEGIDVLARSFLDEHPRVRLEAVVAASFFGAEGARATELSLRVLRKDMDRFLEYALNETLRALEPSWRTALASGERIGAGNDAGLARLLHRLSDEELAGAYPCIAVFLERLTRHGGDPADYAYAIEHLAELRSTAPEAELLGAIRRADARDTGHVDHLLMGLFATISELSEEARQNFRFALVELAEGASRPSTRRLATVARIRIEGSIDRAWSEAQRSMGALTDLLDAALLLRDAELAAALQPHVLELLDGPPSYLLEGSRGGTSGRFVRIELPGPKRTLTLAEVEVTSAGVNVAPRGTATQKSVAWGGDASRAMDGNKSGRYGDQGQTHSLDEETDPWWELDLGEELPIDSVEIWTRTETDGRYLSRLEGLTLRVLDAERRTTLELSGLPAPTTSARYDLSDPALRVRRQAAVALGALGVRPAESSEALVARFDEPGMRPSVVRALRELSLGRASKDAIDALGAKLSALLDGATHADVEGEAGRELLVLADELAPRLEPAAGEHLAKRRSQLGPQVFWIRPVPDALLYDRRELWVTAGRPIEMTFENVDIMPHNLLVARPGALAKVGMAAEAMAAAPDAWARSFIPDLDEVLHHTALLQPGQRETLRFDAPTEVGDYPYVCTFPGHWVRMNGVLHVVDEAEFDALAQGAASDEASAGSAAPGRAFVRNWSVSDLKGELDALDERSVEAGRAMLERASCIRCHTVDGEGGKTAPELREIVTRHLDPLALLTQVLEPSSTIADGYQTEIFATTDGEIIAGRVLEETGDYVLILDDPYQEQAPLELPKSEIGERVPSTISAMPVGLLSTFEKDDVLDLIAYLESLRADPSEGDGH